MRLNAHIFLFYLENHILGIYFWTHIRNNAFEHYNNKCLSLTITFIYIYIHMYIYLCVCVLSVWRVFINRPLSDWKYTRLRRVYTTRVAKIPREFPTPTMWIPRLWYLFRRAPRMSIPRSETDDRQTTPGMLRRFISFCDPNESARR